jgi:hypothetical protein
MSKRKLLGLTLAALLLTTVLLSVSLVERALAQSGGSYDLSWWTVGSGGGTASDGGIRYTLTGTLGQSDVGEVLAGGDFILAGGFLPGFNAGYGGGGHKVYLPIILKNH